MKSKLALVLAVSLLAAACGGGSVDRLDEPVAPTSTTEETTGSSVSVDETVPAGEPDVTATTVADQTADVAGSYADLVQRASEEGWLIVAGLATGGASDRIVFDVDRVIADFSNGTALWAAGDGPSTLQLTESDAERLDRRLNEFGAEGFPDAVLLAVDGDGLIHGTIDPLDPVDLSRFPRQVTDPTPMLTPQSWTAEWLDEGLMKFARPPREIDPDRATYCQTINRPPRVVEPGPGEVDRVVTAATEAIPAHSQISALGQLRREADRLAEVTLFTDPVTGRSTGGALNHAIDQALRAGTTEGLVIQPTVEMVIDATGLDTNRDLVFVEADTLVALGWLPADALVPASQTQIMVPPTGGDLAVYYTEGPRPMCTENLTGEPLIVVPHDAAFGDARAWIDLGTGAWEPWDGTPPT